MKFLVLSAWVGEIMRRFFALATLAALSGCGSITLPAAVKTSDGRELIGTTTAAMSGGTFSVATADKELTCSGTYDAMDMSPTIVVPVTCSDGRYASVTVTRSPDGRSGVGNAQLSDGSTAVVAFGNRAGDVLTTSTPVAVSGASSTSGGGSTPVYAAAGGGLGTAVHSGNCPTPNSLDSAGRRCGARSAASRAGGYDGYSAKKTTSYGGTYVSGHYRKGRWVRGHYRRR